MKKVLQPRVRTQSYCAAQWLSGGVLELRLKGGWFEIQWRHYTVPLSKTLYPLHSTGSTQDIQ